MPASPIEVGSFDYDRRPKGEVVCADALAFLSSFRPGAVGAIITDPPFFISTARNSGPDGGMGVDPWVPQVKSVAAAIAWTRPLAVAAARSLRPGGALVVAGGSQSLAAWEVAAAEAGLSWMAELTVLWNTGRVRSRNFGSLATNLRWYAKVGDRHTFNSGGLRYVYSNVLVAQKVPLAARFHPAQKPVELTSFLVSLLTLPNDIVADPFCGSGSTLVSAALCGRDWAGCDLDPDYAEIASVRTSNLELEAETNPLYFWINGKLHRVGTS